MIENGAVPGKPAHEHSMDILKQYDVQLTNRVARLKGAFAQGIQNSYPPGGFPGTQEGRINPGIRCFLGISCALRGSEWENVTN